MSHRALLALPLLAGACGNSTRANEPARGCTEIGCVNGLTLSFSRPLREPGRYELTLELDGKPSTCQATLPFSGCNSGGGCSAPDVLLQQSGCALPPSEHELLGLQITTSPATLRVRILRDGSEVSNAELAPTYTRSQPNGAGCPPVCEQASATLDIR